MLKEEHVKNIMIQILYGLDYLHSNWIMHRVSMAFRRLHKVIDKYGTEIKA
jgi:hypothetical protein